MSQLLQGCDAETKNISGRTCPGKTACWRDYKKRIWVHLSRENGLLTGLQKKNLGAFVQRKWPAYGITKNKSRRICPAKRGQTNYLSF
jgi:hypothetical protein